MDTTPSVCGGESLVAVPLLDQLARQEAEGRAHVKRNKKLERDKGLVRSYLHAKFPNAVGMSDYTPEVPEKEFPAVLSKAERHYLRRCSVQALATTFFTWLTFFSLRATTNLDWTSPSTVDWGALFYLFMISFASIMAGSITGVRSWWLMRILQNGWYHSKR